jgi:hypothetical protein
MDGTVPDIHREVMKTRAIVSDIRRAVVENQGGSGGKNLPVSDIRIWLSPDDHSPLRRLKPGQRPNPSMGSSSHIWN